MPWNERSVIDERPRLAARLLEGERHYDLGYIDLENRTRNGCERIENGSAVPPINDWMGILFSLGTPMTRTCNHRSSHHPADSLA